jgi:hypothetical protein
LTQLALALRVVEKRGWGIVPIWIEKFALAVLATIFVGAVILNVLKMDWIQRTGLGIGILGFSIYLAQSLYLFNESKKPSISVPISPENKPQPPPENHGTVDSVEAKPEHHGTTDKATAKLGHTKPKEPAKVLPSNSNGGFHEKIDRYFFSIGEGGLTADATVEGLKKGSKPFAGFPLTVFAKDDDDRVHYRVHIWNGLMPLEVTDGEFALNQPNLDRNYDNTALEIVDEKESPLLQVIWKTPSHLVINGVFRMQDGHIVIADINGWRPMKPGDHIKPLFKYPSRRFQGQYVDQQ